MNAGGAFGYMGAERINWGITRVYDAVHSYLTGTYLFSDTQAKTIVKNMSSAIGALSFEASYRRTVLRTWEKKLATVVEANQRKVTQINVAVFGFSRGSAAARAFANWFSEIVRRDGGGYQLAGIPVRIYFMGLFDTVASVGLANLVPAVNGHMAWADGSMSIPATVEQCVHFIALHEQRACFPLESAANVKQVIYPGMHSDVGGGYSPTEQGKLSPCSQIPLNDMHHAAICAGVPLLSIEQIRELKYLKKDFAIPPALGKAYNDYWSHCGMGLSGTVDKLLHEHTHQYLQWRGGMLLAGQTLKTRGFFQRANSKDQTELSNAQRDLVELLRSLQATSQSRMLGLVNSYAGVQIALLKLAEKNLLPELDKHAALPEAVKVFFDDYVHDSRAGFVSPKGTLREPSGLTGGYLRYRNIYQSARAVEKVAAVDNDFGSDVVESSKSMPATLA